MIAFRFAGATAILTGAASGIGAALAGGLAARGCGLVLLDRHAERLESVAAELRSAHPGLSVETVVVDLSDREATVEVGRSLALAHPETTLLINNAGVALAGDFAQVTLAEFDWLMQVNFGAVVTLTHQLLPVLRQHPGSHLVNLSSVFGLMAPASQTAYAASKFAVRGFTEALGHELAGHVGVTCVHPGGIATRIATDARVAVGADAAEIEAGRAQIARVLRIPAEVAAEAILRGVQRRRPRVLIGITSWLPDLLVRLAPSAYGWVLNAVARRVRRQLRERVTASALQ